MTYLLSRLLLASGPVTSICLALPADMIGVEQGTTTVVDAGTAGPATMELFVQETVKKSRTRVYSAMHYATEGLKNPPEADDPSKYDLQTGIDAFRKYEPYIVAIKARASATCVGQLGITSIRAGKALATAACIAGDNIGLVERMPDSTGLKNEIILQKGHAVNYGAPLEQMIRLGGGIPVEAGQVNQTWAWHIESAITEKTAALLYCKSHHVQQETTISLQDMIAIAHNHHLPIIVDAAAEEDLQKYAAMGADMVIYSGAKAVEGPTSGFITGKAPLTAKEMVQRLQSGSPAIYTRNHFVDQGTILIDPRTMLAGDAELVIGRFRELCR